MLGRSTNQTEYQRFVRMIANQLPVGVKKPILLYDGATAHTAKGSLRIMNQYFEPLQNVPHSSPMNSVEHLWACSKLHRQRLLLLETQALTQASFEATVMRALEQVPLTAIKNLVVSNRKYIR